MTGTFTNLHERAKRKQSFDDLYPIITSRENILLAYRMMKANEGSMTAGTDGKTIADIKKLTDTEVVNLIQNKLENYNPKAVRRVFIPKPNGKQRPLGIPCIIDRIIQECFKQVLEPIAEAHFFKHSYGFRPLRSTHHAIARVQHLINHADLHFVVDIDIKGFFDNVNHTRLIKQLWNMGIRDRRVLRIIGKMLKAEISGEGRPTKGTPQGGILSPLLSNIVLHDLDMWVAGQWEKFESHFPFKHNENRLRALKRSNLKEGYIVRYADDFKIICRDWKSAEKWYHAARLYLKDRLQLDISPDKSQIVNLRKRKSEFLGFTIKATKKANKRVAHTGINAKKKAQIKKEAKERIEKIRRYPNAGNALAYNSFVLGLHLYFKKATHVCNAFSRLAYDLRTFMFNRILKVGIYEHPSNPPPSYLKFYKTSWKTYRVGRVYLYPLGQVNTETNLNFDPRLSIFTEEGRKMVHRSLRPDVQTEIINLMNSNIPNRSIEYMDNRISRYSMKMGKCEITGQFLYATTVHCHHFLPTNLGGTDKFNNLRIIHKDIHKLIHTTDHDTIMSLKTRFDLSDNMVKILNQYRKMSNMELI
ncbi:group II intron reverse transcriptase/maturase (plasmid) [Paenibacillus rhizovicinus]|uniref:Group II intron reverse transcriptase/maturase n=1 Tax=Paenibacillus rhizovicinus TaxID=2704463 RepID=A0A6C0PAG5_9BACL|nr:group II intron reverse transcriptase/maturase [Paenibacillus rhizovicinus]QHW33401.1 group II intron reverse transcriptase/maturase [Paenibacillus rhizovicinus]QHW35426.1 group II intron reverse transcriptase/maturase [Paenibacillus rhizovicinus]